MSLLTTICTLGLLCLSSAKDPNAWIYDDNFNFDRPSKNDLLRKEFISFKQRYGLT